MQGGKKERKDKDTGRRGREKCFKGGKGRNVGTVRRRFGSAREERKSTHDGVNLADLAKSKK